MEFAFNEEQEELREMVREFVEKEITPFAAEMDRNNAPMPDLFKKAGDMGLLNVIVPEEYGGPGLDSVTVAMIYEELGKGCAGIATSIAANSLASYPVLLKGTEEQKKTLCDLLNNGGLAAFALTEPGAGSDAGGVATKAVKDGDHYTLNGNKIFITNGGLADTYLIFANTRKSGGIRGLTAFVVPRNTPGFSVGKKEDKMGIRPSNTWDIATDAVYKVTLQVTSADQPGVMANIMMVASESKININSLNVRTDKSKTAIIHMGLDITSLDQLNYIIGRIKRVKGIYNVERDISGVIGG